MEGEEDFSSRTDVYYVQQTHGRINSKPDSSNMTVASTDVDVYILVYLKSARNTAQTDLVTGKSAKGW